VTARISTTRTKKPQPAKRAAADYGQWNKAMFHPVSLNLFRHSAKGEFVVPDKKTGWGFKVPASHKFSPLPRLHTSHGSTTRNVNSGEPSCPSMNDSSRRV
jgi:hypothetical protein